MPYTPLQIIEIAKIAQTLASLDVAKGVLYGARKIPISPQTIYMERKALEWYYNLVGTPIAAQGATGIITIDNIGVNGDIIEIFCDIQGVGLVSLGNYEKQPTDTNTTILAASIAAVLGYIGFTFTANGNTIEVATSASYGSSVNGGISIVINNYSRVFDFTFDITFN